MTDSRPHRVLLVDDDTDLLELLRLRLEREQFDVQTASDAASAERLVRMRCPDVVVTDLKMEQIDGMVLLKRLHARQPGVPVIMMTAHGTIPDAIHATRNGAYAFITKPIDNRELLSTLHRAIDTYGGGTENGTRGTIVTRNAKMLNVLKDARRAAAADVSVLITGATGTGKDMIAQLVHEESGRAGPFVAVNCSAIPEALFEAELFGHVKGAFTSADRAREGLMPAANGGTLFLDEIGEMPMVMQAKMLRALETGEVRPVGQDDVVSVDIRLVSATNRDLQKSVEDGKFRGDLFYRLNVVILEVPTLEERREDIPLLAEHFLTEITAPLDAPRVYAPEAMELLVAASWPGNVRQLLNTVERNVALSPTPVISAQEVRSALGDLAPERMPSYDEAREEFTRSYLIQLLRITNGSVTRAARLAKRNRTDLYKLLQRFGVDRGLVDD